MRAVIVALMLMSVPAAAQVVIDRVLVDPVGNENRNDTPEIIIILNQGTEPQDLTGWTLSSTPPETPDVWTFPAATILCLFNYLRAECQRKFLIRNGSRRPHLPTIHESTLANSLNNLKDHLQRFQSEQGEPSPVR